MKEIRTEVEINSNPEKIWEVLTDFEGHQKWNPFIKSISGEKQIGSQLKVEIQPPESSSMTFKPKVLKYEPNSEFRWKGKFLIKGVFDGEHYFVLQDNNNGTTTLTHGEQFSGILVGLFGSVLKKTKLGFEAMNEAIKKECEG